MGGRTTTRGQVGVMDDEKVINTAQMLVIVAILGAASWVGIIAAIRWAW